MLIVETQAVCRCCKRVRTLRRENCEFSGILKRWLCRQAGLIVNVQEIQYDRCRRCRAEPIYAELSGDAGIYSPAQLNPKHISMKQMCQEMFI